MEPAGAQKSESVSLTTESGESSEVVVCGEHLTAQWYVSKSLSQPFRRFIRCPDRKETGCTFARWVDEEMPTYQKRRVQRLMIEKEAAQLRLECKELLVDVLYEKIRLKDDELAWLRRRSAHEQIGSWCLIVLVSLCILVYI